jgi:hypothetical protein
VAIIVIGVLAPIANAATLTVHDSARQTANAFTSMNAGVLLALLLGILGTTGAARLPADVGPTYRRAIGAKARAYGLVGAAAVVILGGLAAAVALPIIHARGNAAPSSTVIVAYFERETAAGARLALLGVAIGIVAVRRLPALIGLITLLVVEAIAESYVPFIKNDGPMGALNAFSDPSHHHQLSVGAGSAIALGWALITLIVATAISENRNVRATADATR